MTHSDRLDISYLTDDLERLHSLGRLSRFQQRPNTNRDKANPGHVLQCLLADILLNDRAGGDADGRGNYQRSGRTEKDSELASVLVRCEEHGC